MSLSFEFTPQTFNIQTGTQIVRGGGGGGEISEALKQALLQMAEKVAYVDADGADYYQDLYDALYDEPTPPVPIQYTVTNNLTAVTNSNSASTIAEGGSYTGTLSCASDYTITTVSVTIGGIDVTGTTYSSGTISIPDVTGNIVITAVATQKGQDYVTSGLTHRWDGIDNTASGHDSSATSWEDLVGNTNLLLMTGGSWTTNALVADAAGYAAATSTAGTMSQNATVEVYFSSTGNSATYAVAFDPESGTGLRNGRTVSLFTDNTVGYQGNSSTTYTNPEQSISAIRHIAIDYTGYSANHVYVNGVEATLGNTSHSLRYSSDYQFSVGGAGTNYRFSGNIYAVRIYNRALTAAEVAQNYAVDVARFGT